MSVHVKLWPADTPTAYSLSTDAEVRDGLFTTTDPSTAIDLATGFTPAMTTGTDQFGNLVGKPGATPHIVNNVQATEKDYALSCVAQFTNATSTAPALALTILNSGAYNTNPGFSVVKQWLGTTWQLYQNGAQVVNDTAGTAQAPGTNFYARYELSMLDVFYVASEFLGRRHLTGQAATTPANVAGIHQQAFLQVGDYEIKDVRVHRRRLGALQPLTSFTVPPGVTALAGLDFSSIHDGELLIGISDITAYDASTKTFTLAFPFSMDVKGVLVEIEAYGYRGRVIQSDMATNTFTVLEDPGLATGPLPGVRCQQLWPAVWPQFSLDDGATWYWLRADRDLATTMTDYGLTVSGGEQFLWKFTFDSAGNFPNYERTPAVADVALSYTVNIGGFSQARAGAGYAQART